MTSSSHIAATLKFFFDHFFFVTLQSMTVPNFMSKAFSYQDLSRRGGGGGEEWVHYVPAPFRGMIRQKYSGADRVSRILWNFYKQLLFGLFIKGTLMQIWKSWTPMLVFIWKQYPENLAFLILRFIELFARKVCKFLKKYANF